MVERKWKLPFQKNLVHFSICETTIYGLGVDITSKYTQIMDYRVVYRALRTFLPARGYRVYIRVMKSNIGLYGH